MYDLSTIFSTVFESTKRNMEYDILYYVPENNLLLISKEAYAYFIPSIQSLKFSPTHSRCGYLDIPSAMRQLNIPGDFIPPSRLDDSFYITYSYIRLLA